LCGELLQRSAPRREPRLAAPGESQPESRRESAPAIASFPTAATPTFADEWSSSPRTPWLFLALGALTAPVFSLTPLLGFMGWFLASLIHEMGHAGFAWLCGMPAFPAISLEGHAAAMHGEQLAPLVAMIGAGLAWGAWQLFNGPVRIAAVAAVLVLYPALALTSAREVLHLLAGHSAELAFAVLALWKTLDGGFTRSTAERALYSTVGWFLLGKNAVLCWGLMRSESARADYMTSGSFGFTNDYLRVAEDIVYWRLESVALLMLIAALAVLPLAIGLWRIGLRLQRANDPASLTTTVARAK
jgi:hypothetical protein